MSDSGESDNQAPGFPAELTIVGVVLDPQDLTNPDGYSGTNAFRSSATSDYTFFAPSDGVTGSMYTAVTVLVKGASDKDSFSDAYDDTVSEVADRIDGTVRTNRQKARHQELLDAGTKQIDEAKAQTDKQFAAAQQQIDSNRSQLNQQIDQIVNMQAGAAAGSLDETTRETLRETVIAASPQLAEAKAQLDQAQSKLDQQKKDTERTLQSKQNELEDSIPQVRWYVQDRSQIGGFSSLKSDLESIQSLGNAFPIVFLLVAVMMSLTAMARMVEEDRGLIGTYTGLGYGRLAVASRYLLFALFACLIGGGLGLIAGFLGIPAFLLVVLRGLYVMPDVRLEYDWLYGTGRSRAIRNRRACRNRVCVRAGNATEAGQSHAPESAACRIAHSAGAYQAVVESHELSRQSHGTQHFPLQIAPDHDGRRRGRLHRADCVRTCDQRHRCRIGRETVSGRVSVRFDGGRE